jgi:hypothetical protein
MNMMAPITGIETDDLFSRLRDMIGRRPDSPDDARTEARRLVSRAIVDTCHADNLWGAVDAFHAHFDFMMQAIDLNGAGDPGLRSLRTKCRFYLEQVEALCQSQAYR